MRLNYSVDMVWTKFYLLPKIPSLMHLWNRYYSKINFNNDSSVARFASEFLFSSKKNTVANWTDRITKFIQQHRRHAFFHPKLLTISFAQILDGISSGYTPLVFESEEEKHECVKNLTQSLFESDEMSKAYTESILKAKEVKQIEHKPHFGPMSENQNSSDQKVKKKSLKDSTTHTIRRYIWPRFVCD